MFLPTATAETELSQPPHPLVGLTGAARARCLVRLHGVPLGEVEVPLESGICRAETLRAAALRDLAGPITRQHLLNLLAAAGERAGDSAQQGDWTLGAALNAPPAPPLADLTLPSLTVAVCTRDRPEDLGRCLEALLRLDYPGLDLLVVDNAGRTDATERVVAACGGRVRLVREERPGLDWARNRAVLEARGEVIAFTDDDVVVDPGWARALGEAFAEDPAVMAVTGLVLPLELSTEAQALFERYGGFGRGFVRRRFGLDRDGAARAGLRFAGSGQCGTGANMAYRRRVFDEVGYFDPALDVGTVTNGGGDLEMFFRVIKGGHPLVYEPRAVVRHRHRREYAELRTQLANNGVGFYSHLVRSALAYPEEREELLRLGAWWFGHWNLRRLLGSFVRPPAVPRDLILAEIGGVFQGLTRYQRARLRATELAQAGDPPFHPHAHAAPPARTLPGVAVRHVHLEQLPPTLEDVTSHADVRVVVCRRGTPIGTVDLHNGFRPVGGGQLREAIVDALWLELLEGSTHDPGTLQTRWTASLHERYGLACGALEERLDPGVPVSVVVATRDRPDDLRGALRGLVAQQTARPTELIVVDNHPASGLTPPVVAEFPGVRLVQETRAGSSYARNAGFLAARGEVVAITDDDVVPPPDWLEQLVAPFTRDDVLAVTGNVLPLELDTPSQRLFEAYGGLGRGFTRREVDGRWWRAFRRRGVPTWELGATANAAFRASIFRDPDIGLLEEALGAGMPTGVGEDTYLFYRVLRSGGTLVYQPSAWVHHRHRRDPGALRRQLYAYSKGHVAYHLLTWMRDGDGRGLLHVLTVLPWWRLRQVAGVLTRRRHYPLSLIALEIRGNLTGPWALWQASQRVRREGRSLPALREPVGATGQNRTTLPPAPAHPEAQV